MASADLEVTTLQKLQNQEFCGGLSLLWPARLHQQGTGLSIGTRMLKVNVHITWYNMANRGNDVLFIKTGLMYTRHVYWEKLACDT